MEWWSLSWSWSWSELRIVPPLPLYITESCRSVCRPMYPNLCACTQCTCHPSMFRRKHLRMLRNTYAVTSNRNGRTDRQTYGWTDRLEGRMNERSITKSTESSITRNCWGWWWRWRSLRDTCRCWSWCLMAMLIAGRDDWRHVGCY